MKKSLIPLAVIASLASTAAFAVTRSAKVWHVEKITQVQTSYQNQKQCSLQNVPVYRNIESGSNSGDVLAGMILGGLLGKGVSGNDKGAAAGAIFGAVIAADKTSNKRVVSGYRSETVCTTVNVPVETQSYTYIIRWKRQNLRGYIYSDSFYSVGDTVYVDVPYGQ